jgi:DNA-binding NarL/FixJ family response regulator
MFKETKSSHPALHSATGEILIVEDHPRMLSTVSLLLEEALPEHLLLAAASAESALSICSARAPKVIILDISLPGMNGLEATPLIRALVPGARIIMHSSYDEPSHREAAMAAGASAFVSKRRTALDLIPTICRMLFEAV